MFKHRKRVNAAFAKGLMFGKAVGARDERDRIVSIILDYKEDLPPLRLKQIMQKIKGETNE